MAKNTQTFKKYSLLLILFWVSYQSISQNMKFKRLSVDEGLSAVTVNTIFQDSDDFIWIGTQDGLNRYDGYHFRVFKNDPFNPQTISSNDVRCIFQDNKGIMYFGSNGGGLSVFNKYTERFTNYTANSSPQSISSNIIKDIIDVNDYELMIATANGVVIFNKESKKFKAVTNESDEELVFTDLFKDASGKIWVGSENNYMFEFDLKTNSLINYTLPDKFQEFDRNNKDINTRRKSIYSITQYHNQLICGSDGGLLFFNLKTKSFESVFSFDETNRYNNRIKCFSDANDSLHIWFGTWGGPC